MLATTIQALEVQKMTLTTLKTMNVSLSDLQTAVMSTPPAPPKAAAPAPAARPEPVTAAEPAKPARKKAAAEAPQGAAQPAVDAMEWWGALTKQFSHLANAAVTDTFKGPGGRNPPPAAAPSAKPNSATAPAAAPRKAVRKTVRSKKT